MPEIPPRHGPVCLATDFIFFILLLVFLRKAQAALNAKDLSEIDSLTDIFLNFPTHSEF